MSTFVRIILGSLKGGIRDKFAPRRMIPEVALIKLLQARNVEQCIKWNPEIAVIAIVLPHGSI
jgi:hypothetical protein